MSFKAACRVPVDAEVGVDASQGIRFVIRFEMEYFFGWPTDDTNDVIWSVGGL